MLLEFDAFYNFKLVDGFVSSANVNNVRDSAKRPLPTRLTQWSTVAPPLYKEKE